MKKSIIIICSIVLGLFIMFLLYCRYVGTKGLIVKEYLVKNSKIPTSFYGTKVVQISDIHYGRITKKKELENVRKTVNKIKPDIIVITGDILDKDITYNEQDLKDIIDILNSMNAKYGKYIISGNHDLVKNKDYNKIIEAINFTNLDDSYQILYNETTDGIMITGLSTMDNKKNIKEKISESKNKIKSESSKIKYNILIVHEPDIITSFDYKDYDLILAGHSHGGQVRLPLIGGLRYNRGAKKYHNEYYKLNKSNLYISSGVGTSRHNLRLNNKPSISLYRLVNK